MRARTNAERMASPRPELTLSLQFADATQVIAIGALRGYKVTLGPMLVMIVAFWLIGKLVGNRVPTRDEVNGLDIPEMGVLGYVNEDPIEVKNAGLNLLHGGDVA